MGETDGIYTNETENLKGENNQAEAPLTED